MMELEEQDGACVALLEWYEADGITAVIEDELACLGYRPLLVRPYQAIPAEARYLFTYGPYGKSLAFLSQLEGIPAAKRPVTIHWNTEGIPDPRLPWPLIQTISSQRSWSERWLGRMQNSRLRPLFPKKSLHFLESRMLRFRYLGDLYYAYGRGWLHILADSSQIYAQLRSQHGLPTLFVPWGITPGWYADLELERDIDVLWMGKRASRRRAAILDGLRDALRARGITIYMADNEESPFIFDDKRTEILNRSKITLNVTRTWYDDNFSRFVLAAPNRSLIVSETLLPHCPYFEAGTHYVSAPADDLLDTILCYLEYGDQRRRIVENCYNLVRHKLTLRHSIKTLMRAAQEEYRSRVTPLT